MKQATRPCPICKKETQLLGKDDQDHTLTECGHRFSFRTTKAEKISQRGWATTPWGLEKIV